MISEPVNLKRAVSREHWRRLGKPAIGNVDLPFLLTAGALIPFLAVGCRSTPRPLKQTALFLLPVLFLSSLLFSWLDESRNYMPVVFVFAVIAAHALTQNPSARAERPGQLE